MLRSYLKGVLVAVSLSLLATACSGGNNNAPTVSDPGAAPSSGAPAPAPAALTDADKTEANSVIASLLKLSINDSYQVFDASTCSGLKTALKNYSNSKQLGSQGSAVVAANVPFCDDSDHFSATFNVQIHYSDFVPAGSSLPAMSGDFRMDVQNSDGDNRIAATTSNFEANGKTFVMTQTALDVGGDPEPSCSGAVTVDNVSCQVAADCQSCAF